MGLTKDEVLHAIRDIASRELDMTREIAPTHELLGDLELDSISLVTLLACIENRFRVRLPATQSLAARTVGDVVHLIIQGAEQSAS